jgi:hypothetical protein
MKFSSFLKSKPMQWSIIIFILAQALMLLVVSHEDVFLKKENLYIPPQPTQAITIWPTQTTDVATGQVTQIPAQSSLLPILIYFPFGGNCTGGCVIFHSAFGPENGF